MFGKYKFKLKITKILKSRGGTNMLQIITIQCHKKAAK